MMFFFIGGVQPKKVILAQEPDVCPSCAFQKLYRKRIDQYIGLFFIPVFAIKKGTPFLECEQCQSIFSMEGLPLTDDRKQTTRRCPSCGRPLSKEFSYCPYCGKSV
jgi:hypothetical protein